MDTFQLLPAHGEEELDVIGVLCVEGKLVFSMAVPAQVFRIDSHLVVEVHSLFSPVREPLILASGLAEELHFHLLKFTGAEDEVLCGNLVAEALADLGNAEGNLHATGLKDILEVHIDALGRLRAKVHHRGTVLVGSDVSLEHEVEVTGFGEAFAVAAHGTWG